MLKPVIAATALLAIVGSSFVYAQARFDGGRVEYGHRFSADDAAAFTDARIAGLKAGLQLTPEQAKNWPAFEAALRNLAQLRIERIKARQTGDRQPPAAPLDRLAQRADAMARTSAALKQVAEAGAPLYQSLDEAQKARFTKLASMLRPRPMHAGWRGGRDFDGDGRGFGGPGFGHRGGMHRTMDGDGDQDTRL
jgi:hypothetical protein